MFKQYKDKSVYLGLALMLAAVPARAQAAGFFDYMINFMNGLKEFLKAAFQLFPLFVIVLGGVALAWGAMDIYKVIKEGDRAQHGYGRGVIAVIFGVACISYFFIVGGLSESIGNSNSTIKGVDQEIGL